MSDVEDHVELCKHQNIPKCRVLITSSLLSNNYLGCLVMVYVIYVKIILFAIANCSMLQLDNNLNVFEICMNLFFQCNASSFLFLLEAV